MEEILHREYCRLALFSDRGDKRDEQKRIVVEY